MIIGKKVIYNDIPPLLRIRKHNVPLIKINIFKLRV